MATFSSDIITSSTFSTTALKVTSGASSGYLLQSDASGNATWVTATSGSANFANTNLTFNAARTHNTNGFDLTITTDNGAFLQSWLYMGNTEEAGLGYSGNYISSKPTGVFAYFNNIAVATVTSGQLQVSGTVSTTTFRMTSGAQSGYVLTSDGSGNATWQASSGGVSGTGTASYVTKWSSSTGLTNSIIYDSGTAIGLGTASPSELLHVDGNVRFGGQVYVDLATTLSPSTNSQSIDWNNSNIQTVDFQNAPSGVTFSFSNPKSGGTYTIKIIQGANLTSITWPTTVKWESGTLLLPTQVNDAIDIVTMVYDGTNYYASFGKNFA